MTLGIVLTVFANTKKKKAHDSEDLIEVNPGDLFVSVSMMLCAMLLRSLGNVVQQRTYKMYGKHVTEVMFYQHALVCQQQSHRAHSSHSSYEKTLKYEKTTTQGLPFLLWSGGVSLRNQMWQWTEMSHAGNALIPRLYVLLFCVMVLNFCVTKACAQVVGLSNAIMLNLVLTVQRFLSIVFSATIINAPPYPPNIMWFGSFFVIIGCFAFFSFDRRNETRKKKRL